MLNNTTKPIVFSPRLRGLRGGDRDVRVRGWFRRSFQKKPFATCYINVTTA